MSDTIMGAIITALAPVLAVVVSGFMTRKQVGEVHSIVNQQRTDMLNEISTLKTEVLSLRSAIVVAATSATEAGKK